MLFYYNKIIYFIITFSLIFLASCATQQEVDMLKWTIQDMKKDLRDVEDKTEKGVPGGGDFSRTLNSIKGEQEALKQGQGEVHKKLQNYTKEIQSITNRLDQIENIFGENGLSQGVVTRQEIIRLERRINDLSAQGGVRPVSKKTTIPRAPTPESDPTAEPSPPTAEPTPPTPVPEEKPVAQDPKSLYTAGRGAYKEGDTQRARALFNQIIKDHPKSPYSENAQYWIGETYYKEKDYELAFMAFQEVLRKNPKSKKAPASLYKQALSFYKIGDKKAGEYYLKRLIENYPTSEEAQKAKTKLGQ